MESIVVSARVDVVDLAVIAQGLRLGEQPVSTLGGMIRAAVSIAAQQLGEIFSMPELNDDQAIQILQGELGDSPGLSFKLKNLLRNRVKNMQGTARRVMITKYRLMSSYTEDKEGGADIPTPAEIEAAAKRFKEEEDNETVVESIPKLAGTS